MNNKYKHKYYQRCRYVDSRIFEICKMLDIPQIGQERRFYRSENYSEGSKQCVVDIPNLGKRKACLYYVSKNGIVHVHYKGKTVKLPEGTKCYANEEFDLTQEIKRKLKKMGIWWEVFRDSWHAESYLHFTYNNVDYSIQL
jgi:hypothetical protein